LREYDESDAKVRPNPRGNRPRSKQRPAHLQAAEGFVTAVDRGRIQVAGLGADGAAVTAVKARELGRRGIVVGDRVAVVGDTSGDDGALARIVRREARDHVLRRSADDDDTTERVIVANADQLAIVAALADPEPNRRFIDRCLVAAFDAGMDALLVATKADLARPDALAANYRPLGVTVVPTQAGPDGIDGLAGVLGECRGKTTVLVGSSGVGKSTLVNAMAPSAFRATGRVNDVTGRGRHTSSSAVAFELAGGGWIIDTPGIRSFGLAHVDADHFVRAFPDVAEAVDACPRGCTHESAEAGCALDAWADTPDRAERLDSIRRLISSRSAAEAQ
jgi:ribosome biogenesis GTPase